MHNIFLSWSGALSKEIAQFFGAWVQNVVQVANPWISSEDVRAGSYWSNELRDALHGTNIGILFLTQENLSAPWVNFEAGALCRPAKDNFVCPVLIDLTIAELCDTPLSQFDSLCLDRDGMWKLTTCIHERLAKDSIKSQIIETAFKTNWSRFHRKISDSKRKHIPPIAKQVFNRMRLKTTVQLGGQTISHETKSNLDE